ncbi:hypothetical protein [Plantibacter sp. YIM 135249]|uniref:hypothetical protein n=1 Tax=Plantibacter sp. YIM 135249 TaxID=3423918 RepID=UPI003D330C69
MDRTGLSRRSFMGGTVSAAFLAAASTLTGCGPAGGPAGGGAGATTATSGAGGSAGVLPSYLPFAGATPDSPGVPGRSIDVFFSYPADPVRVTNGTPGDGAEFTALTLADQAPPPLETNRYWQMMHERLGSPYRPSFAPGAEYPAKFATVTASGAMPDFFTVLPAAPAQPKLLAATAADLTEHLAGDAVAEYPFLANIPTESWRGTVFDGRIRALPIPRGIQSTFVLYGRTDLLAAAGITDDPRDFAEFRAQLEATTDARRNRWALASVPLDYVRQTLAVPNVWSERDGVFRSALLHDAQEDALEATRRLFADGLVHPDVAAMAGDRQKTWVQNGTSVFGWFTLSAWPTLTTAETGAHDARGTTVPAFTRDGSGSGAGTAWLGEPNHSIVAISADAGERVTTLLRIADWLATPFGTEEYLVRNYGVEGVHYTLVDGVPRTIADTVSERALGLGYLSAPPRVNFSTEREVLLANQAFEYSLTGTAVANPANGLFSETQAKRGSVLGLAIADLELEIVRGRKPVSAWKDGVAAYRTGGGDRIRSELEAAFAAAREAQLR